MWRDVNADGKSDMVNCLVIEQLLMGQEMALLLLLLLLLKAFRTGICAGVSPVVTLPA